MKSILFALSILFTQAGLTQSPAELISMIKKRQQQLVNIDYTLIRTDTLVTGDIRTLSGKAKITVDHSDSLIGFYFTASRDDLKTKRETIYDGQSVFEINHSDKKYQIQSNPASRYNFLGNPGGQIILPDLVTLDTARAVSFQISQDGQFYYLKMFLPDLPEYDVTQRYTLWKIDKKLLLPLGMRSRQETLGKVQDLNYTITSIQINNASLAYNFSKERFPSNYSPENEDNTSLPPLSGKQLPDFPLKTFDNRSMTTADFIGKPTLLDFWEVWCGPCLLSMPKVQLLQEKYAAKGLAVFGITREEKQLSAAKLLLEKRKITFPTLIADDSATKALSINAIPFYILLDRKGKIAFMSLGFSAELENEIIKLL